MSYITSIGVANPPNKFKQSDIANFMVRAMQLNDDDARKLRALYRATGIETRYSVIADYGKSTGFEFFPNTADLQPFPPTRKRLELFRHFAIGLSVEAAQQCLSLAADVKSESITHLIAVSCTGMYAPGLDIDMVKALRLRSDIKRTCINFMGCYAAFNALKLADSFCNNNPEAKVLIVCTELCSIHFQKENTNDNILANALFGDGSAALLVQGRRGKGVNLRPESFHCDIALDGEEEMAWTVGDVGFEMKLSAYVPAVIQRGIKALTDRLLSDTVKDLSKIDYFAIHPGGRKILEVIESALCVCKEKNEKAYNVLKNYGNMSSPTVLFVLNELRRGFNRDDHGKRVLSFAFGPGLTMESMILAIEIE